MSEHPTQAGAGMTMPQKHNLGAGSDSKTAGMGANASRIQELESKLSATQARESMLVEALKAITDHVFYECDNEWLELCDKALSNSTEHHERFMAEVKAKTLEDLAGNFSDALVRDFILGLANELREMK